MTSRAWTLLVFALTLAVYGSAASFGWIVEWDDGGSFVNNPLLRLADPQWIFVTAINGHWVPLTWLTHVLEFRLWGIEPGPWHLTNILLHALNAALVYALARRLHLGTAGAVVAALVWSLHPLRIEAVAWITERRLLLACLFVLLATLAWMAERRVAALLAYFAAIMSHPIGVMLPWALLALDGYRYRGCGWSLHWYTLRRLAPMFTTGAAASVVIVLGHQNIENSLSLAQAPALSRLWQTAYSLAFYLQNTILPVRLSPLIEYTFIPAADELQYPLAAIAVLAVIALCVVMRRVWPALIPALIAYAIFVLPQAGLAPNGPQLVANRYSYLAAIPLAFLLGGAFTKAWQHRPRLSLGLTTLAFGGMIAVTLVHLPMWKNGEALWTYAADHEPTCTLCQDLASVWAYRRGDYPAAIRYTERGMAVSDRTIFPRWERHWNLAVLRYANGDRPGAAEALRAFIAAVPPTFRWMQPDHDRLVGAQRDLAMLEGR